MPTYFVGRPGTGMTAVQFEVSAICPCDLRQAACTQGADGVWWWAPERLLVGDRVP